MMRPLLLFCALAPSLAHATNCALAPGTSVATINAAIVAAGNAACTGSANSTNVALAGSYSITSQIQIPCGANDITITGPTVPWPGPYTAVLNGPVVGNWGAYGAGQCAHNTTIRYIMWDGHQPQPGGGGFLYLDQGAENYTITDDWFQGFQGNTNGVEFFDAAIYLAGVDSSNAGALTDNNINISWNQFGNPATGDCSNLMNIEEYTPGHPYSNIGGNCGVLGYHTHINNSTWNNNRWYSVEEGIKGYSAGSSAGCNGGAGACVYYNFYPNNLQILNNDFQFIHRIAIEIQNTPQGTGLIVQGNDVVNWTSAAYGSFAYSLPSCCRGTGVNNTTCYDNISDANTAPVSGSTYAYAYEYWSSSHCDHNLIQGAWQIGVAWGPTTAGSGYTSNYNVIQMTASTQYYVKEVTFATTAPTQVGNVEGQILGQLTSAAPTIFPTPSGTYSSPITVTLSDAGWTGNTAGPRGNTSVYYTIDGSAPGVNSTFCGYSCSFSISPGTTVNAIGMFGAQNQPTSYPAGYGFKPSAVQSWTYSSGSAPTLTSVALTLKNPPGGSSVQVGNSVQACATMTYTGPITTPPVCGSGGDTYGTVPNTWASSAPAIASISSTGSVAGLAVGTTNLTVKAGSFTSAPVPLTVTSAGNPVLQSVSPTCATGTVAVGQTITCSLQCNYTGPSSSTCPNSGGGGSLIRGRPRIVGGSLVADDGQPLRFVAARLRASEWGPFGSQQSWWQQMHDVGHFNGVRVVSGFQACTPSCSFTAAQIQTLLDQGLAAASATGMYMVIDDHDECCANQNLATDTLFWNAIAPRYANNTNVIYEAKNEPNYFDTTTNYGASGTGYPGYETAIYNVIRPQAPNTHIIMWSTSQPYDVSQATQLGWYTTASTISYANASVGVHPYNMVGGNGGCTSTTSCAPYIARLSAVQSAGYAVILTEFDSLVSGAPDQQVLQALDGIGVSWMWDDFTGVWTQQAGPCSSANVCGNPHNEAMNIYWTVDPNSGGSPSWSSSTPAVATIGATTGALLGVAAGNTQVTGNYGGLSNQISVAVTSSSPPAATLVSVAASCSPASVVVGFTVNCTATGTYSDGTKTNCTTTDSHGNLCNGWASSATGVATVVSSTGVVTGVSVGSTNLTVNGPGVATSPPFALPVIAAVAGNVLGNSIFNVSGGTYPNYNQSVYAVTPSSGTSTVGTCSLNLGTATHAAGALWDCGLVLAPTPTTQATSWLCHSTYTTLGTSADNGWHLLSITGCGNLGPSTGVWVTVNTNETGPAPEGYWNCGSSCTGSAPTSGNGTYPCRYVSANYGVYTGMSTAMSNLCGYVAGAQASQYVTLTAPIPTLVGGYLTTPGSSSALQVGSSIQVYGVACYSDGTCYLASPTADQYGDSLTSITSSAPSVMTVGAIGGMNPALATGISAGTAALTGVLTGGKAATTPYSFTINNTPTPLPPSSPRVLSR